MKYMRAVSSSTSSSLSSATMGRRRKESRERQVSTRRREVDGQRKREIENTRNSWLCFISKWPYFWFWGLGKGKERNKRKEKETRAKDNKPRVERQAGKSRQKRNMTDPAKRESWERENEDMSKQIRPEKGKVDEGEEGQRQ